MIGKLKKKLSSETSKNAPSTGGAQALPPDFEWKTSEYVSVRKDKEGKRAEAYEVIDFGEDVDQEVSAWIRRSSQVQLPQSIGLNSRPGILHEVMKAVQNSNSEIPVLKTRLMEIVFELEDLQGIKGIADRRFVRARKDLSEEVERRSSVADGIENGETVPWKESLSAVKHFQKNVRRFSIARESYIEKISGLQEERLQLSQKIFCKLRKLEDMAESVLNGERMLDDADSSFLIETVSSIQSERKEIERLSQGKEMKRAADKAAVAMSSKEPNFPSPQWALPRLNIQPKSLEPKVMLEPVICCLEKYSAGLRSAGLTDLLTRARVLNERLFAMHAAWEKYTGVAVEQKRAETELMEFEKRQLKKSKSISALDFYRNYTEEEQKRMQRETLTRKALLKEQRERRDSYIQACRQFGFSCFEKLSQRVHEILTMVYEMERLIYAAMDRFDSRTRGVSENHKMYFQLLRQLDELHLFCVWLTDNLGIDIYIPQLHPELHHPRLQSDERIREQKLWGDVTGGRFINWDEEDNAFSNLSFSQKIKSYLLRLMHTKTGRQLLNRLTMRPSPIDLSLCKPPDFNLGANYYVSRAAVLPSSERHRHASGLEDIQIRKDITEFGNQRVAEIRPSDEFTADGFGMDNHPTARIGLSYTAFSPSLASGTFEHIHVDFPRDLAAFGHLVPVSGSADESEDFLVPMKNYQLAPLPAFIHFGNVLMTVADGLRGTFHGSDQFQHNLVEFENKIRKECGLPERMGEDDFLDIMTFSVSRAIGKPLDPAMLEFREVKKRDLEEWALFDRGEWTTGNKKELLAKLRAKK
ncbi:MAG: hypothetical protein MI784_15445 [Cytophagales bacterium]|nr:hypothetical protein [Cytophagales bacterium]